MGLPENQVVLSGDGHWFITLDYRKSEKPTIRWIDIECHQDIHICHGFELFIDGLIIYDQYMEN